jgi:hypothetical protein
MTTAFVAIGRRFAEWTFASAIGLLALSAHSAFAQQNDHGAFFLEHDALTPPLLFRETWQQPPHTGELNDDNRRITKDALTNPDLTLQLYGLDAANIQVTSHNGIPDLWNGFTTSPVALTLKLKGGYLDLTGLTRMRWRTRTENLHVLHPVVKLADGTLLVGSQTFQSPQRRMVEANWLHRRFRRVRGDVRRSALVPARSSKGRREARGE